MSSEKRRMRVWFVAKRGPMDIENVEHYWFADDCLRVKTTDGVCFGFPTRNIEVFCVSPN